MLITVENDECIKECGHLCVDRVTHGGAEST